MLYPMEQSPFATESASCKRPSICSTRVTDMFLSGHLGLPDERSSGDCTPRSLSLFHQNLLAGRAQGVKDSSNPKLMNNEGQLNYLEVVRLHL